MRKGTPMGDIVTDAIAVSGVTLPRKYVVAIVRQVLERITDIPNATLPFTVTWFGTFASVESRYKEREREFSNGVTPACIGVSTRLTCSPALQDALKSKNIDQTVVQLMRNGMMGNSDSIKQLYHAFQCPLIIPYYQYSLIVNSLFIAIVNACAVQRKRVRFSGTGTFSLDIRGDNVCQDTGRVKRKGCTRIKFTTSRTARIIKDIHNE